MIPKVERFCKVCNKIFYIHPYFITQGRGKFCSHKCYSINLKGNKRPQTMNGRYKKCLSCNKKFYVPKCLFKIKTCSKECGYKIRNYSGMSGSKHPSWKGGRILTQKGYIDFWMPSHPFSNPKGYVREHRLVVEREIGRYLKPTEKVHHIGEKTDNVPNKLMAFVSNSAHIRFEYNPNNVNPEEIIFDGRKL